MNAEQSSDLLKRYLKGNCSEQERQLVERWYLELEETGNFDINDEKKAELGKRMETWLLYQISLEAAAPAIPINKKSSMKAQVFWWAAAAIIIVAAGLFALVKMTPQKATPDAIVRNANDVMAPGSVKASITLANGQKVLLDSLANTDVAAQNGVKLVVLPSGEVAYEVTTAHAAGTLQYNTLTNPRGSKVATIVLADGSKIWLNTASSLTYPIAFDAETRKVSITGEAYFEIAHNASKPFIVSNNGTEVSVLGTEFNVNSYDEEQGLAVTLLQGSVRVSKNGKTSLLKPGQQARVNQNIEVENDVNTEQVMAWKNGMFHFDNASLSTVLNEIGRWYNMDVRFEGAIPQRKFGGEISRKSTLGEVLKILEESDVHFKLIGNNITVIK